MKNKQNQLNYIFLSSLFVILIWMASTTTKANLTPTPFPLKSYEAHYSISWFGIPAGESVHKLHQKTDGNYHFESRTLPKMQMLPYHYHESTDFAWKDGQIYPHNYHYNIKEGKRRKQGHVHFNWDKQTISNAKLKEPWQTEITEGIQDKLTQTLCLRQALKSGSKNLKYTVAEEDKIKDYDFVIVGSEKLKTKIGNFDTLKVEHVSRKGIRTTLWLAKKLEYLPVKMSQMRQGKVVASGEILTFTPRSDNYARSNT